MKLLKLLSKPTAWASGWTSTVLCFSAASGYWLLGSTEGRHAGLSLVRSKWQLLSCKPAESDSLRRLAKAYIKESIIYLIHSSHAHPTTNVITVIGSPTRK